MSNSNQTNFDNAQLMSSDVKSTIFASNTMVSLDDFIKKLNVSDEERASPSNFNLNISTNLMSPNEKKQTIDLNSQTDNSYTNISKLLNEYLKTDPYNMERNRYNSCSIFETWTSPASSLLDESKLPQHSFNKRHNSFNQTHNENNDSLAESDNRYHFPNKNYLQFDNKLSQSSGFLNSFDSYSTVSANSNLICFDKFCSVRSSLKSNENMPDIDTTQIRFQCNLCHLIAAMHRVCFDKRLSLTHRRNSYNSTQLSLKQLHNQMRFNCYNCQNGFLKPMGNSMTLNQNVPISNQTSCQNVDLNNNYRPAKVKPLKAPNQKNAKYQFHAQNNQKSSNNQQSSVNSFRKKSICSTIPQQMQPVKESRSPSPNKYNSPYTKRQSAPVNMPKNRFRTVSMGSTDSFSANSSFSSSFSACHSPNTMLHRKSSIQTTPISINQNHNSSSLEIGNKSSSLMSSSLIESNLEGKLAQSGSIFDTRKDWSILTQVPLFKQNSIHIRLEDEGPYGNDETRCFLLSYFSTLGIRAMSCVLCSANLNIYDTFPLVNGTFFVSPINYNKSNEFIEKNSKEDVISISAKISNKNQFIYVICLQCLHLSNGHEINCKGCHKTWDAGSYLQIGTMYRYEIFAAFPCCQNRLNCSNCDSPIVDFKNNDLKHFSSFSQEIVCPSCKSKDYHFIKNLNSFYEIKYAKD